MSANYPAGPYLKRRKKESVNEMQVRLEKASAEELMHYSGKKTEIWAIKKAYQQMLANGEITDADGHRLSDELNP
jgi:hypothetical protein